MKVAIIRRRIHPHGGVEGYGLRLIRGLKARGLEVGVLAEQYEPEEGIKFHPVKTGPFTLTPGPVLFNRCCQKILEKEKFDLVHSLERTWPQDIYRAGEGCHAEFIKTLQLKERLNPKHLLTLYTEKKTFLFSSYIMANSERVKREIMAHYGIPEERIVVIYTGVDTDRFNPEKASRLRKDACKKMNLNDDDLNILFVGSGFRRKGLGFLLKALARVLKQSQFKLLVAGKGNFRPYIKLADSLGIGQRIKFLGLVKDIDPLYASVDLLVLPSIYEPFSNACLEAMACGIPVVTTRANGVSEILESGLNNLIIENPYNTEEIAHKIKIFASRDVRRAVSLKVHELARKFSFSRHMDEVLELYEKTLKQKRIK